MSVSGRLRIVCELARQLTAELGLVRGLWALALAGALALLVEGDD